MRAGIALASLALVACSQQRPAKRPSIGTRTLTIQSAGSTAYNEVLATPTDDPLVDALVKAALDAASRHNTDLPVADARLSSASTDLANVVGIDADVPHTLVEFAVQSNGVIEPEPHVFVTYSQSTPEALASELRPLLATLVADGYIRIGAARGPRDPHGGAPVVVAMQKARVRTSPIPRSVKAGATVAFDITLRPGEDNVRVAVTRPSGASELIDVPRIAPSTFKARVECGPTAGKMQLELIGRAERLALFPVWCGVDAPTTFTFDTRLNDTPNDPLEAERRILEPINRERERLGTAALVQDSVLAEIARQHSREMGRTGVVAVVLDQKESVDALVRARNPDMTVTTSVSRALGLEDLQQGLLGYPSFRVRLTSPSITHIGLGIAYVDLPTGGRALYVTVILANGSVE